MYQNENLLLFLSVYFYVFRLLRWYPLENNLKLEVVEQKSPLFSLQLRKHHEG